jgi:hypothetical protein
MDFNAQHKSPNQNQGPNYLQFKYLSTAIQERLLKRQSGKIADLSFKTSGIFFAYFCIVAAIVWFAVLLFNLTNDYLWSQLQKTIFVVITVVAVIALAYGTNRVFRWFTSRLKCYFFITPLYFIRAQFDDVCYWRLNQLVDVKVVHHYYNGAYTNTTLGLIFDEGQHTISVKGQQVAQDVLVKVGLYQTFLNDAVAKNDVAYLTANDDFRELRGQIRQEFSPSGKFPKWLIPFAAALVLGVTVLFTAFKLNGYYDDKKSWDSAQSINRASAYRNYIKNHPQGRRVNEAQQKIQQLYDVAAKRYETSRKSGYDKQASDAILQALNYAKTTQNYRVRVIFERHNEIPEDAAEKLKKKFGVQKILSFGDAFDEYKMGQREKSLLYVVSSAFKEVIPEDVLELTDNCANECVTFLVNYKVKAGETLYYRDSEATVSLAERTFYPSIFIDWDFEIRIPKQTESYKFSLKSNPAETITYAGYYGDNPSKDTVYDSMVMSAFNDFKSTLVSRLGVGSEDSKTGETKETKSRK